jgi:hypothetical protein
MRLERLRPSLMLANCELAACGRRFYQKPIGDGLSGCVPPFPNPPVTDIPAI